MKRLFTKVTKGLFIIGLMVCCSSTLQAQNNGSPSFLSGDSDVTRYQLLQFKMGFNLGWGFPYSGGLEFALLFDELVDVNAGVGIGLSGFKYGGGFRFYPIRKTNVSPMIGGFIYHATGMQDLNVSINLEEATFDITPDTAFLLNGGIRLRFGRGNYFTVAAGYIFPFQGEQAKRQYGSRSESLQNMANAIATSGFSFNVGIQVKLSSGDYEL